MHKGTSQIPSESYEITFQAINSWWIFQLFYLRLLLLFWSEEAIAIFLVERSSCVFVFRCRATKFCTRKEYPLALVCCKRTASRSFWSMRRRWPCGRVLCCSQTISLFRVCWPEAGLIFHWSPSLRSVVNPKFPVPYLWSHTLVLFWVALLVGYISDAGHAVGRVLYARTTGTALRYVDRTQLVRTCPEGN